MQETTPPSKEESAGRRYKVPRRPLFPAPRIPRETPPDTPEKMFYQAMRNRPFSQLSGLPLLGFGIGVVLLAAFVFAILYRVIHDGDGIGFLAAAAIVAVVLSLFLLLLRRSLR